MSTVTRARRRLFFFLSSPSVPRPEPREDYFTDAGGRGGCTEEIKSEIYSVDETLRERDLGQQFNLFANGRELYKTAASRLRFYSVTTDRVSLLAPLLPPPPLSSVFTVAPRNSSSFTSWPGRFVFFIVVSHPRCVPLISHCLRCTDVAREKESQGGGRGGERERGSTCWNIKRSR